MRRPALQLAWQGRAPPYDAMQLDALPGGPPCGSFHVLAAAALGEAAGGAALAAATPSAGSELVEGTPCKGPGAGRKAKGTSSSQYRCGPCYLQPELGMPEPHTLISRTFASKPWRLRQYTATAHRSVFLAGA